MEHMAREFPIFSMPIHMSPSAPMGAYLRTHPMRSSFSKYGASGVLKRGWLVPPVHCRELAFTLVPELCSVWNRCRVLVSIHDISKETIPCCVVLHGRRLLAHQNYSKNWERSQYLFCEMPKPTYVTHAQQLHNPFKYHAQQSCFLRWSILENTRLGKGFIPTC